MKCWNCGFEIERGDSAFCPNCGADLRGGPRAGAGQGVTVPSEPPTGVSYAQTQRYVTPLPSNGWDTTSSPTAEYDSLGAGYQTPETMASGDAGSHAQAKEDYKRAKRELKQARKRAGKSNAPKVVAAIVAILLVGAGGAAAAYYTVGDSQQKAADQEATTSSADDQRSDSNGSATSGQTDATDSQRATSAQDAGSSQNGSGASATTSTSTSTTSDAGSPSVTTSADGARADVLVGTWTGTLGRNDYSPLYCYGSQAKPPVLTIKSVDSAGKVVADLKVCYHAHEKGDNSVDSSPGDVYIEADDITMSMSNSKFSYTFDVSSVDASYSSKDSSEITFVYDDSSGTPQLTAKKQDTFYDAGYWVSDTNEQFTFTKTS